MTDIEERSAAAKSKAEAASQKGTFSFLDRLADRNYAEDSVEVFLDEKAGHQIRKLTLSLAEAQPEDHEHIEAEIEAVREKARDSRYIVHLQGISTESFDAVVDAANKEFPPEYEVSRNPLTMATEREEKPNEDRDQYFRTHLWAKFIKSVEDADGNVDENITPEWVAVFIAQAPIIAQARVSVVVNELRMMTDWMDELQGEDFLAKS